MLALSSRCNQSMNIGWFSGGGSLEQLPAIEAEGRRSSLTATVTAMTTTTSALAQP
jgi:hypothetical protein